MFRVLSRWNIRVLLGLYRDNGKEMEIMGSTGVI